MDMFAPPSKEELSNTDLFAPPSKEELGGDLFAPPSTDELSDEPTSQLETAAQQAAQGASFGFADEIEAGLRSVLGPEKYEAELQRIRERNKRGEETFPATAIASQLAGGVASSLIPGIGAIGTAARGAGVAKTAAAGAAGGALAGLGSSERESAEDTVKDVGAAAAFGGVLGAGAGKLGKLLSKSSDEAAAAASKNLEAAQSIVDDVDNQFESIAEDASKFASDLYDRPDLVDDKFATYLLDGNTSAGKELGEVVAKKQLSKARSQLSKEDFLEKYRDFKRLEIADDIGETVLPEDSAKTAVRTAINSAIDAGAVFRNIDQRLGTDLTETGLEATRNLNMYQVDLAKGLLRSKPVVQKALSIGSDANKRIVRAIDNNDLTSLKDPTERQIAEELGTFFKSTAEDLRSKGVPISELAGGTKLYVPNKMVSTPKAVSRIRSLVQELGGEKKVAGMLTNPDIKDPRVVGIRRALDYLGVEDYGVRSLQDIQTIGSPVWTNQKLASSLYQRSELLPDFLQETDIQTLVNKYLMENYRYANVKNTLQKLRTTQNLLDKAGAKEEAEYVGNLLADFNGTARLGDKRVTFRPARLASQMSELFQLSMHDKAATLPVGSNKRAFYEYVAERPDAFKNMFMNIYPNFLGANVRAPIQNIVGTFSISVPELGYTYGTKGNLKAAARASKGMLDKAYMEKLRQEGFVAPQWTNELLDTFKKGGRSKAGQAFDKSAQAAMYLFEKSEQFNRALVYELAGDVAQDAMKKSKRALNFIDTMPPSLRKKTLAALDNDPATADKLIKRYMSDRYLFSYNKLNQSELARGLGPLLSTFTKYPLAVAGRALEPYRDVGRGTQFSAGLKDTTLKFVAPYVALSYLTTLLPDEIEKQSFGDAPGDEFQLGKGLASASPVGALTGLATGKIAQNPLITTATSLAEGVASGDPEALARWAEKSARAFAPGGVGAWYRLLENMEVVDK
jgi:hypothetical protein